MKKIRPEDLEEIARKMKRVMNLRKGQGRAKIIVHMGSCGISAGARTVMTALIEEIDKRGLDDVLLTITSCAGLCVREPMVTVELDGQPPVKYVDLTPEKAVELLDKHVLGGEIVRKYALEAGGKRGL